MIEEGNAEIGGIGVAKGARALVMVGRRQVADGTILPANGGMIEKDDVEIGGVAVAQRTSTRIMIFRCGMTFQAILFSNDAVVEACVLPVIDGMTGGAVAAVGALVGIVSGMAGSASGGCAIIGLAGVAVGAEQVGMAAS